MREFRWFFITTLCLLIANNGFSQVELIKELDENEYICSYNQFEGVDLYATFDTDNNEIKIYNSNHELQSSFNFDVGKNYSTVFVYGLSRDVFNSDDNIEFLISKFGANGTMSNMLLQNDQNIIIQEFSQYTILRTIGSKNYLIESKSETKYDHALEEARVRKTDKLYAINGKFRKLIY